MHAGAAMVLPVEDSDVKQFKKADTEQQANSAVVHEQASSVAPSVQTEGAPPADTLVTLKRTLSRFLRRKLRR